MSYYGPPAAPPGPPKPSSYHRDPRFDGGYRPTNEGDRAYWDNVTLGVHDHDDRRRGARAPSATHRHRHLHQPQQQPHSNAASSHYYPSESYVNLKLGSHLHKVHPLPIYSDQITLVPSLFGYERNETTFAELREEWGPTFRHKYGSSRSGTDALTTEDVALPGDGTMTASKDLVRDVMAGLRTAGPMTSTMTPGHHMGPSNSAPTRDVLPTPITTTSGGGCSITNGASHYDDTHRTASDDDSVDDEAEPAVPTKTMTETVVQRVCQYFSIDPSRTSVTVALRYGSIATCQPRRAHPYGARGDDCFAVASFGAPRQLVLVGRHSVRYELELSNNTVIAMMGDVTNQLGWMVGIDNILDYDDEEEDGTRAPRTGQRPKPSDRETITVFIHGRCRAMSTTTTLKKTTPNACGTAAAATAMPAPPAAATSMPPPPAADRSRVVPCSDSTREELGDNECQRHDDHPYQSLKEDLDKSFMEVADGSKGYDPLTSEEMETHAV